MSIVRRDIFAAAVMAGKLANSKPPIFSNTTTREEWIEAAVDDSFRIAAAMEDKAKQLDSEFPSTYHKK